LLKKEDGTPHKDEALLEQSAVARRQTTEMTHTIEAKFPIKSARPMPIYVGIKTATIATSTETRPRTMSFLLAISFTSLY